MEYKSNILEIGEGIFLEGALTVDKLLNNVTANNNLYVTGNVGIGTTSPITRLHVAGGSSLYTGEIGTFSVTGGTTVKRLNFGVETTGTQYSWIDSVENGVAGRALILNPSGGNVGIGTASPGVSLDVSGSGIRITNATPNVYFNNTVVQWKAYLPTSTNNFAINDAVRDVLTLGYNGAASFFQGCNVGIGTTSPGAQLEVASANTNAVVDIFNLYNPSQTSSGVRQRFRNGYGDLAAIKVSQIDNGAGADNGQIEIQTSTDAVLSTKLTILDTGAATFSSSVTASSLIKSGGTASQYLMADGSTSTLTNPVTGTGTTNYVPKWTSGSAIGNSALQEVSGNLGLGVTPSAWQTDVKAIQIGDVGSNICANNGAYSGGNNVWINNNSFQNSSVQDIYTRTATAGQYNIQGNTHIWRIAPSGTAGNAITFTQAMTLDASGNLGIGTTAPTAKLQVVGTGTVINLSVVGNIKAGGTGSAGGEIITSGALGNGNFASFRHDDNNAYITVTRVVYDGHLILQPYANVGIGTTSPAQKLDVDGSVRATGGGFEPSTSAWINAAFTTKINGSPYGGGLALIDGTTGWAQYTIGSGANLVFAYGATSGATSEKMRITSGGNVGIGTTSPSAKLEIVGSSAQTLRLTASGIGNGEGIVFADGGTPTKYNWFIGAQNNINNGFEITSSTAVGGTTFSNPLVAVLQSGNVGIGTTSPGYKLHVSGNVYINETLFVNQLTTVEDSLIVYDNVGIGTTSPSYKLDVQGTGMFTDELTVNGVNIGRGGGSLSGNTRVGDGALSSNTTGNHNSAFGLSALVTNTTGEKNSAVGMGSLYYNTTGSGNVSVGITSLQSNTTGGFNLALGYQAGYGAGAGANANTTGNNNIFIGNQSVGTSPEEHNRTWIGNSSTTSTWVGGNLLVGTTANAGHKLHVAGSVRIDSTHPDALNTTPGTHPDEALTNSTTTNVYLGIPDVWLKINVAGVDYVFPGYAFNP